MNTNKMTKGDIAVHKKKKLLAENAQLKKM